MKKLGIAILLGLSVLGIAGCGSDTPKSPTDPQALHKEVATREKEDALAHMKWFKGEGNIEKALNELKARPELQGQLKVLDGMELRISENALLIDVVKPGTKDVYRYFYYPAKKAWSEPQKVKLVGPGKKTATDYAYDISLLAPNKIGVVLDAFEKRAQTEGKDAYIGFVSYMKTKYKADENRVLWEVESAGGTGLHAGKRVGAVLDSEGNFLSFKAKIDQAVVDTVKKGMEKQK